MISVRRYISPLFAIRAALGNLGLGTMYNTLEGDLIRWTIEAQDKISKKKTTKKVSREFEIENNSILICEDMLLIDSVCIGDSRLDYIRELSCNGPIDEAVVPNGCNTGCGNIGSTGIGGFYMNECFIRFMPEVPNGTLAKVTYHQRAMGADGYPMILESAASSIAEYISWKLCVRVGDNRAGLFERNWYFACRQARAELNSLTQSDIEKISTFYLVEI